MLDDGLDLDAVWSAAYDLCVRRRAMLLVDPPPDVADTERARSTGSTRLGVKGPNAVAHFPRLRIPDPTDDFRPRTVAPSGTLAGLYARTDAERGVWKAPAGTEAPRARGHQPGLHAHRRRERRAQPARPQLRCARSR